MDAASGSPRALLGPRIAGQGGRNALHKVFQCVTTWVPCMSAVSIPTPPQAYKLKHTGAGAMDLRNRAGGAKSRAPRGQHSHTRRLPIPGVWAVYYATPAAAVGEEGSTHVRTHRHCRRSRLSNSNKIVTRHIELAPMSALSSYRPANL